MQLQNPHLLQTSCFINNRWTAARQGNQFTVYNPANGQAIASVADGGANDADRAIAAAADAFTGWSALTAKERGACLRNWYNLILANASDLALIMTTEQGKPLKEAEGEIAYGASFVEWFAEEARRVYGDVIPTPANDKRIITIKQPIGVVGAITPWNFPVSMITRKISPAVAAGCTVVIKPASQTPLCALALAQLALEAGFPPGVINVVTSSSAAEIGERFTTHPQVKKCSFTGSTKIGKLLMQQCAGTVKKVSLELGGNAPVIVFNDADVALAVKGTLASKYRNAGQTCVCANRIYVQDKIYPAFMKAYTRAVAALKVGDGTQIGTDIGPLIDGEALKKVNRLLKDATKKGGHIVLGGQPHTAGKLFFEPTIIENCTHKMALSKEEIFGPVAAVYRFTADDEAVAMANDTEYGLASYIFTQNVQRAFKISEALQYGMVGINEGIISHAEAPFGGVKESGIGREGSRYGIEEYVEIKYLCFGGM